MENPNEYRLAIVTGQYGAAPEADREMIRRLFGAQAEQDYEIYFHWYNLLHEIGHAIMMFYAAQRPHPAQEEQLVNDFAVAYWRHYGEEEKLSALSDLVRRTVGEFDVPTNLNHLDYAMENWGTTAFMCFEQYGWFQFSCVEKAIAQSRGLAQVLTEMGVCVQTQPEPEMFAYEMNDDMAQNVVTDAAENLKRWGVRLPDEIKVVFCDDVNCHYLDAQKRSD